MLTMLLLLQAAANAPAIVPKSPTEIVAQAPASDWVEIAADDLLVMQLAPGVAGMARRVVIQLMPPPFSQPWIANIRTLAKARWWDGTSVNRVQDNYVVQWGDATEKKGVPSGFGATSEQDYTQAVSAEMMNRITKRDEEIMRPGSGQEFGEVALKQLLERAVARHDSYAWRTASFNGWPVATNIYGRMWPVHCYGMVGVGRNLSPDAGNGTELYTVIGHAPRHLDRNIALVGRVVEGIEHLSSLPRGTGNLGFYEDPAQRVAIATIRLASELPEAERPRLRYLSTESASFAAYADARANRRDAFFNVPAGGADICNVPVPVRRAP